MTRPRYTRLLLVVLLALIAPAVAQESDHPKHDKGVGLVLNSNATAEDLGLPIYPGARRQKDTEEESSALTMGAWSGTSGFRLVVLKLTSDDAPEKVAEFYRKALAKYGAVLDCSKPGPAKTAPKSNGLACEDDEHVAGGFTLKAGTKQKQHAVGIEPDGRHSTIALVYVEDSDQ